jgi:itaconyl-CoA hydratase
MALTGADNFFEDFVAGDTFRHARGKTITDFETATLAQLVMNTADGHFNADAMRHAEFGVPVVFGGIVASLVLGIASQDTAEHATEELGIESMRFPHPVRTGDTVYAESEVLAADDEGDPAGGLVRFRHSGINQDGETVCEVRRTVRLRRRAEGQA